MIRSDECASENRAVKNVERYQISQENYVIFSVIQYACGLLCYK